MIGCPKCAASLQNNATRCYRCAAVIPNRPRKAAKSANAEAIERHLRASAGYGVFFGIVVGAMAGYTVGSYFGLVGGAVVGAFAGYGYGRVAPFLSGF